MAKKTETKAKASAPKKKARKRSRTPVRKETEEDNNDHIQWSKSKKKRMRLLKAKQKQQQDDADAEKQSPSKDTSLPQTSSSPINKEEFSNKKKITKKPPSSLQTKFQQRLSGSRFRVLNEELYTSTSSSAFHRFQSNPTLFDDYHAGFRQQVRQWPTNPVDMVVERIRDYCGGNSNTTTVIADFGCGDAALAKALVSSKKSTKYTVHSLDLVAKHPLVTACDMAHTPLQTASVHIGVFCLALMGTNLADFIREAHRVLRKDGVLYIVEVRSRFEESTGNKNLSAFLKVLEQLGFACSSMDRASNTMFVFVELTKNDTKPSKTLAFTAKPCVYKRR